MLSVPECVDQTCQVIFVRQDIREVMGREKMTGLLLREIELSEKGGV